MLFDVNYDLGVLMRLSKNKNKFTPIYNEDDQIINEMADGIVEHFQSFSSKPHDVFEEYIAQKCLKIFSDEKFYKDHLNRGYKILIHQLHEVT